MPPKRIRVVQGTCAPCKSRRVLCDLQKPKCGKCISAGLACDYGVQYRWTGVAARGRFARQSVPAALSSTALTPKDWQDLYFQREFLPRFSLADDPSALDFELTTSAPVLREGIKALANAHRALSHSTNASRDTTLDAKHARLAAIRAFRAGLQDAAAATPALFPDVFSANVLLCILDGVIAPHDPAAATSYHFAGGKAILQQLLLPSPKDNDDQLNGVANVSVDCSNTPPPPPSTSGRGPRLPSILLSVFATMDLTVSVLGGVEPPLFEPTWWLHAASARPAWWTGLHRPQAFLAVIAMFAEIANLAQQQRAGAPPLPLDKLLALQLALERTAGKCCEGEHSASCSINSSEAPRPCCEACSSHMPFPAPPTAQRGNKQHQQHVESIRQATAFTSAFRSAARVYLYRTLCGLASSHPLVQASVAAGIDSMCGPETNTDGNRFSSPPGGVTSGGSDSDASSSSSDADVTSPRSFSSDSGPSAMTATAAGNSNSAASKQRSPSELTGANPLLHCLLFPLLLIGGHCTSSSHRRRILAGVRTAGRYLSFGSVRVLEEFLVDTWNRSNNMGNDLVGGVESSNDGFIGPLGLDNDNDGECEPSWWDTFAPVAGRAFIF